MGTRATDRALEIILDQFSDSPNFISLLTSVTDLIDESNDILDLMLTDRTLDDAYGVWLDEIGEIVGCSRPFTQVGEAWWEEWFLSNNAVEANGGTIEGTDPFIAHRLQLVTSSSFGTSYDAEEDIEKLFTIGGMFEISFCPYATSTATHFVFHYCKTDQSMALDGWYDQGAGHFYVQTRYDGDTKDSGDLAIAAGSYYGLNHIVRIFFDPATDAATIYFNGTDITAAPAFTAYADYDKLYIGTRYSYVVPLPADYMLGTVYYAVFRHLNLFTFSMGWPQGYGSGVFTGLAGLPVSSDERWEDERYRALLRAKIVAMHNVATVPAVHDFSKDGLGIWTLVTHDIGQVNVALNKKLSSLDVLLDGDCESATTTDWTADAGCVLSKETYRPHGGSRVLRATIDAGATSGAYQEILYPGDSYIVRGYARPDGLNTPVIYTDHATLWTGTTDQEWQEFELNVRYDIVDDDGAIYFGGTSPGGSVSYVDYDDLEVILFWPESLEMPELMADADMEFSDATYWPVDSNCTRAKSAATKYSGDYSLCITGNAVDPGYVANANNLEEGSTYRISGWARGDAVDAPEILTGDTGVPGGTTTIWTGVSDVTWQMFHVEFVAEGVDILIGGATNAQSVYFDSVSIKKISTSHIDRQDIALCEKYTPVIAGAAVTSYITPEV